MAPARPVRGLSCDDSFRTAAGKIIWTRFEEMLSFRDVALEGRDPEGVHDMRVASRRLRAALELFRDVFPKRRLKPLLGDVKRLADALGRVRDLDVMVDRLEQDRTGPPSRPLRGVRLGSGSRPRAQQLVLKDMVTEMKEERAEARRALKQTVEELEQEDFPRRFVASVARETT